jgi:hypothetical protein
MTAVKAVTAVKAATAVKGHNSQIYLQKAEKAPNLVTCSAFL